MCVEIPIYCPQKDWVSQVQCVLYTFPTGGGGGIRTHGAVKLTLSKRVQLTTMRHLLEKFIEFSNVLTVFYQY